MAPSTNTKEDGLDQNLNMSAPSTPKKTTDFSDLVRQ